MDDVNRLTARVDDLTAHVAALSAELSGLSIAYASLSSGRGELGPKLFRTLDVWVRDYFAVVFVRPLGGDFRWCARWPEHPEAVTRLDALWSAWEVLRSDEPAGMATWLTSLLDPQLPILLGRPGPFAQCSPTRHESLPRLDI